MIPYVLVPKVADLPAFNNLRGLHAPIVSTAAPKPDTLRALAARMDKLETTLAALLTLNEGLRQRSAKAEPRPETPPQSPSDVSVPSGSTLLPTFSTVPASDETIETLQTAGASSSSTERISALTKQQGDLDAEPGVAAMPDPGLAVGDGMTKAAGRTAGPSTGAATGLNRPMDEGDDDMVGGLGTRKVELPVMDVYMDSIEGAIKVEL